MEKYDNWGKKQFSSLREIQKPQEILQIKKVVITSAYSI